MSEHFFCEDLDGDEAVLLEAEAHHLLHVLRLGKGARVQLLDGKGTVAEAEVSQTQRHKVVARVISRQHESARTEGQLIIAAASPKGDRFKWMIEKLTELGVDQFIPLQTSRTIVDPRNAKLDKLQATVVAAMKQCGRRWLMNITEPTSLETLLQQTTDGTTEILIAHPYSSDPVAARRDAAEAGQGNRLLLIGPEGGFTDNEVAMARQRGAQPIAWPGTILRIETAAIAFAAILGHSRKSQQGHSP